MRLLRRSTSMVAPACREVGDSRMAGLACLPVKNPGRRCRLEQKESARCFHRIVLPRKGVLQHNLWLSSCAFFVFVSLGSCTFSSFTFLVLIWICFLKVLVFDLVYGAVRGHLLRQPGECDYVSWCCFEHFFGGFSKNFFVVICLWSYLGGNL